MGTHPQSDSSRLRRHDGGFRRDGCVKDDKTPAILSMHEKVTTRAVFG